ncbi:MAG: AbiU2 domain-containing protein [Candidatus Helarchaeota archaeon]
MKEATQLPDELKHIFGKLENQVNWLYGRWAIYRQLFGISKLRIDLLNESAPTFFRVVQDVLMDYIQLTLSKLADPARTRGGEDNLCLETIYKQVKELKEHVLQSKLKKSLQNFKKKCEAFKVHRDKRIAHFDFNTMIKEKTKFLPRISRQMIENALNELSNFMNIVNTHFTSTETAYEYSIMKYESDTLVEWLKRGLRYEELWREGKIEINDLQKSKYYDV